MRTVASDRWSVVSWRRTVFICLLLAAYCQLACSIPNLEKPQCTAGRDVVRRFYSFHFGNDMHPTDDNLKARQRFLTGDLYKSLSGSAGSKDYFTASDEFPKTFKMGKCELPQSDKANVQVQIYWRDDTKTVQKEVNVEAIEKGGSWLINKVSQ